MERMKNSYENRSKTFLTRRTPVIIRIDGKAFHTYTRGLDKPFDEGLIQDMNETAIYLCQNIQGVKCAYVQSDEISILVTDYDNLDTQAWFDYNVQKMVSISASLATAKFNQLRLQKLIQTNVELMFDEQKEENQFLPTTSQSFISIIDNFELANFDSRVFNIPKDEVANYFLARQKDAVKNSISTVAQSLYSQKELENKNGNEQQEMIFQKGINWNDFPSGHKRGRAIAKNTYVNNKLIEDKQEYVIGDLWYQPNNQSQFYPDKRGRLLELSEMEDYNGFYKDWCDAKIESVRTKWEVVETPLTFNETFFKKFIN